LVALGFVLGVERADGLGRVDEGGVGGVDLDLRDDRRDRLGNVAAVQLVGERLADLVADGALGVGDAGLERDFVELVLREVAAQQG